MMDLSVPYYEDHTRVSNSSIGWFLKGGPSYFYKMLKGEIEGEKTQSLERGTMIHSYLLMPEEFQKDYVIWDKSRPSSAQQEKFCKALASSLEIEPNKAVLEAYKTAYSTKGKSEETMLSEGSKIASTLKDYINYLKSGDQRIMIGPWDYHMLKVVKNNIKAHKLAHKILWPLNTELGFEDPFDVKVSCCEGARFTQSHEFHINWEYQISKDYSIKCKSLLDGLTLDFVDKKAIIYDLKTTAKLWHFEESIEMYDYLRQLEYYTMAVKWYLKNELGEDSDKWKFEYYIIGIDTTGTHEIRVFTFHAWQPMGRYNDIIHALRDIAWHQTNNKWDHSRAYYEGDGSETLNL